MILPILFSIKKIFAIFSDVYQVLSKTFHTTVYHNPKYQIVSGKSNLRSHKFPLEYRILFYTCVTYFFVCIKFSILQLPQLVGSSEVLVEN